VFVKDVLVVVKKPLHFETRPYFAGFSANSGNTFSFKQNISNWILETDLSAANLTAYIPPQFIVNPIEPIPPMPLPPVQGALDTERGVFGHCAENQSDDSIDERRQSIRARLLLAALARRFESTFTWTPTNCDEIDNGADGYVRAGSGSACKI
jgi:hypothetical protein